MAPSKTEIMLMKLALAEYPANGKPPPSDPGTLLLQRYGLIEEREQKKRCKECGTERTDYRWFAITPSGRLFMSIMGLES